MIEIPRCLARRFRAVLRRCLPALSGREPPPPVRLRAGPDGLTLAARLAECAVVHHQLGPLPPEEVIFTAGLLADVEGKDDTPVQLEVGGGKGQAHWADGGVPRHLEFQALTPADAFPLPEPARKLAPFDPSFLRTLGEAVRTSARDVARYALTRVELRGRAGELVATDGRQLLLQRGFPFPWAEDVLVPALPVFAGRDLPPEGPVTVGRTATHVTVRAGPWTFILAIDPKGRFPDVQCVIPPSDRMASRLHLSDEDARFLAQAVPRLPGRDADHAPVTLDLGREVVVRARADDAPRVSELVLAGSRSSGPAVRVAFDRRYLVRAAQLGFREAQLRGADCPVLCRDERRTYVFMPLGDGAAVPPTADALRVASDAARTESAPQPERRKPAMSHPPPGGPPPREPAGRNHHPPAPPPGPEPPPDLLAEAEAVRSLLQEAQARMSRLLAALKHQKRQSRALEAAVASLRNLPLGR